MNLSKLVKNLEWSEVKASLICSSPFAKQYIKGYRCVFVELQRLLPVESEMRIIIQEVFLEEVDDEPHTEVTGRNGELNRDQKDFQYMKQHADSEYANAETDFSLSFTSWEEWLGMEIYPCSFDNYTASQIVAHCMRDMAFHGFEQSQVQSEKEDLQRSIDEWNAMTNEEKERNSISMEEMRKRMEKWKTELDE